jgi:hypothetical protein
MSRFPRASILAVLVVAGCQAPPPSARQLTLRCGTMPRLVRERAAHPPPDLAGLKSDGPLQLRDGFGVSGTPRTSTHFALRSGPMITLSDEDATTILDALETAYRKYVVDMGLPAPIGSAQYYVNTYIGNSGGGAPDIDFEGAYTSVDNEGFPYMTIHPSLLQAAEYLQSTTAHELFHTIQDATGPLYDYEEGLRSGWWWEATAEWGAVETFPQYVEEFAGAYAMQPQISVNYMDYPDEGTLIEYHHYGAAILPRYLTEKLGDWTIVRDTWKPLAPPSARSAVAALDRILAARTTPTSLRGIMADFALRNTIWDYRRGDLYSRFADETARGYGRNEDLRIVAEVAAGGTTAESRVDDARLPWGLAYNVIRVKRPTPGPWTVAFHGDATGSAGDPATFDVIVARVKERTLVEAQKLTLTDGAATLDVPEVKSGESLLLVVASIPEVFERDEIFGYTYELRSTAPVVPDMGGTPDMGGSDGTAQGGGCSIVTHGSGTGPIAWVALAFGLAVVVTRRRRA